MLSSPYLSPAERIEVEAYAEMFAAAPPGVGAELARAGAAVAVRIPGVPLTELNRIVGLTSIAELEQLEPLYEGGRTVVSLDPAAGLDTELEARGYAQGYPWQKFERGVEPYVAPTDLRIEEADRAGGFGAAIAGAFGAPAAFASWFDELVGRPGWSVFASFDGDRCIGGGALFVLEDPGVSEYTGWLGIGGTLADARGRGSQGAVFAARIDRARELGVTRLVTETGVPRDGQSGPSYRNMLRVGFEPTYVRPNYVKP